MLLSTKGKIALASLIQRPVLGLRAAVGLSGELETERGGIRWHLDIREGIDFSIWLLGAFEPRTIRAYARIIRPGDVVLDIGANVGAHTLPLAKCVGEGGRVYAFEPVQWALLKLRRSLSLNPRLANRVRLQQLMLGEKIGDTVPETIPASWPMNAEDVHPMLRSRALPTAGAKATTLDAFVEEQGISRINFIKIDVDGNECHVLRGARDTLKRLRPPLIVELSPHISSESGDTMDTLLDLLAEAGYQLNDLRRSPLPRDRAALYRQIPHDGSINALALSEPAD